MPTPNQEQKSRLLALLSVVKSAIRSPMRAIAAASADTATR
jgi:hypothetical protein